MPVALALALAGCSESNEEELQSLNQRVQGLEKQTSSLKKDLRAAERARKKAERRARKAKQALIQASQAEPPVSDSIAYEDTCGILPGDGYYSYVKVTGIDCEGAEAIAGGARDAYCSTQESKCLSSDPEGPGFSGSVNYKGWICSINLKWEQSEIFCASGSRALLRQSGS
jgi:outer membrane murein-binding lipoprotein Lpp